MQSINAIDIINTLERVEYDQNHNLENQSTFETPQSHQCGFISQEVQQIAECLFMLLMVKLATMEKKQLHV